MARPNVVVMTTHDSGRVFGCYGVKTVQTPRIDALAADGVLCEQMQAVSPICSPSRGGLLTGRYPLSNGLVGLAGGVWNWEMVDYRQHLSYVLKEAGYRTAMFGFQHDTKFIERLGFDETEGHGVKDGERSVPASEVAAGVATWLKSAGDGQPFYAQIGFHETHTPYDWAGCEPDEEQGVFIPPAAWAHDWPDWYRHLNRNCEDPTFPRRHLAAYQGSVRAVDGAVGTILDALAEAGLEEETLVLFNTDHGIEAPGCKWTLYDGGVGVAFILRWPGGGVRGGRRCEWLLNNVDFLPTLGELAGVPMPENVQGVSFAAACRGEAEGQASPREVAFANWVDGLNFSARTERYKLIRNLVPVDSTDRECPYHELYDLALDPLELSDVAREPAYAEALAEMVGHLDRWLAEQDDPTSHEALPVEEHKAMVAEYRRRYEASRGIVGEG